MSSLTIDPEIKQTVGAVASTPLPASIPILDQPKATITPASASKQDGPNPEPQPNDPAAQKSPPSQPRPNTPETNSDPKGGNDPQQGSDPNHGSGNDGNSGQDEDPKLDNNPNQADKNQGSNQDADPVAHFGPSALSIGTSTVPLAPGVSNSITTTIAGQAIVAAPNAATVAGTTIRPGASGITLAGTLISLNTASQLMIGSKTIALGSASQSSIVTTIGGQVITAAPNGIAIAGTVLTPGASHVFVGGALVSLNTAGQLIVGSKTITLQSGNSGSGGPIAGGLGVGIPSEVADPLTTTVDGQVITAEPTALAMAGTTLTAGAPGLTINGTVVSLNTAAQLVVGSKTIPLRESAGSSRETAGLGGLILEAFRSGAPFGHFSTDMPTSTQGNSSVRAGNGTGTGVQIFRGNGAASRGSSPLWRKMAVLAIAVSIPAYMCRAYC